MRILTLHSDFIEFEAKKKAIKEPEKLKKKKEKIKECLVVFISVERRDEKNPEKAERNRILQAIRNRRARSSESDAKMEEGVIAKMDASKGDNFEVLGQFWMVPVIAKMDALKVNIVKIPICYP